MLTDRVKGPSSPSAGEPPPELPRLLEDLRTGDAAHRPPQDLLTTIRQLRDGGHDLDEQAMRSVMRILGIDPGPVWDRPFRTDPARLPIRPHARTRFEALLEQATQ